MFISDDEKDARLNSLDNLLNRLNGHSPKHSSSHSSSFQIKKIHNGGRPLTRTNDTDEDRAEIGISSLVNGPTETARLYGTTISRASLLSKGIVTHGLGADPEVISKVKNKKDLVHEKALDIIMSSLGSLEDKLDDVSKPRDLSIIAANMSKIVDRTGNSSQDKGGPKVQVVVYAPRVKSSSEFEEVEV